MRNGAVSFAPSASIFAPIRRSGSMMRPIGRFERDASPTSRLSKGCPASIPASSRIVVPELPQSISAFGAAELRLLPCTMSTSGSGCSILIPQRTHRDNGAHAIVAREKAAQDARSVGQRRDHDCAMGNALVARHRDFRFDPGCAFYAKVIHGLKKAAQFAGWSANVEKNPKLRRNVQHCGANDRRGPCGAASKRSA